MLQNPQSRSVNPRVQNSQRELFQRQPEIDRGCNGFTMNFTPGCEVDWLSVFHESTDRLNNAPRIPASGRKPRIPFIFVVKNRGVCWYPEAEFNGFKQLPATTLNSPGLMPGYASLSDSVATRPATGPREEIRGRSPSVRCRNRYDDVWQNRVKSNEMLEYKVWEGNSILAVG